MTERRTLCWPAAAIVLAAGAAQRMGTLKQLLPYKGRPLIEHAIQQALQAGFHPLIVVIGADGESIRKVIAAQPLEIVQNDQWRSGMGSSIAAGVARLREITADSAAVAVLLADQPLVTAAHLAAMRALLYQGRSPVVAARYNGILGVPALFKRELFPALISLPPESGARELLRDRGLSVIPHDLPEAAVDVDTPDDFAALTASAGTHPQR